ncbi:MAG: copper chaperone PCu(A)C [Methyloceanibacter sp.]
MSRPSHAHQRADLVRTTRREPGPFGLSRVRIVEIGVALLLTLAAILFVGLTVWAAEIARIKVAGAWARPTVGQGRISAAYMTIANEGEAGDRLKSARTPKAKAVELHQTTMTADGVMQMRKVEDGLPIEAGASLVLEPGGAHLMLLGLEDALRAGEEFILTLEFANAGALDVTVPVSADAPAGDSHPGH